MKSQRLLMKLSLYSCSAIFNAGGFGPFSVGTVGFYWFWRERSLVSSIFVTVFFLFNFKIAVCKHPKGHSTQQD